MNHRLMMINLLLAFYWFDEALQSALKESGFPSVNRTQSLVLCDIASGEQRASRIAKNIGISRQAINQVLNGLIEQGLIVTCKDPGDSRALLIDFSPEAAPLRKAGIAALGRIEAELGRRIGAKSLSDLQNALLRDWGPPPLSNQDSES